MFGTDLLSIQNQLIDATNDEIEYRIIVSTAGIKHLASLLKHFQSQAAGTD
jgi:hypothetical protein